MSDHPEYKYRPRRKPKSLLKAKDTKYSAAYPMMLPTSFSFPTSISPPAIDPITIEKMRAALLSAAPVSFYDMAKLAGAPASTESMASLASSPLYHPYNGLSYMPSYHELQRQYMMLKESDLYRPLAGVAH